MSDKELTRRDLLKLTAVAVASGCAGGSAGSDTEDPSSVDAAAVDPPDAPKPLVKRDLDAIAVSTQFALGVMAGDALADRAIVWTKYAGETELLLYVEDAAGVPAYEADVVVAPGGFVHVDVTGLQPGTRYVYAFLERDGDGGAIARSPLGKLRTALADDALEAIVFAGVSCTSQFRDTTAANLGRLANRGDLSFVVHLGDQLYADFPAESPARSLADFRAKYAHAWSRSGHAAVHAAHGMYNTWDDHEVYNNWWSNPDPPRIAAGTQAYFEHQPIRREPMAPQRQWRSVKWGRTLELFVLDCRGERDAAAGKIVSDAQLAWLVDGLRASPAVFKFIASSCPIGNFPATTIDRWRAPSDRWANPAYAAQRTTILDVAQEVGGVWWLSGDFHFGTVGRVSYPNVDRHTRVREVLMGAGGQSLGTSDAIPAATRATQVLALDDNTNWTFATPENNFVIIRVNPVPDATHPTPWLDIAFYDATTQLYAAEYRLL